MFKKILSVSTIVVAITASLGLSACGGGGSDSSTPAVDTSGSAAITALQVADSVVGTGTLAVAGNDVTVNYTGWLYDVKATGTRGAQFDSSVGKTPYTFKLGASVVIKGWDQGVAGMKVGGKRTLTIPASLGYGANGVAGAIPPNAALVFDVELLSVK
ncbi:FKBP-type peptidyl-prolyl cis-trans isomerase [Paucibacter sp. B2R-40]|uniref:FKBP-type peptidyl-prolyl cis-trans isomerase n=1 Tax=Paucibacter sp. B2R-40 TaxID=2893554 RepID=UPI0021E3EA85|nr:FKBP-type peptidyl-prolyl cis-trans isomerase [Paucibacter sp. B2R-40]MCV2352871.1 FKBP-type peptidyl-prolyl cis-trans isomerase [Paucibacter sp. B2R-40]